MIGYTVLLFTIYLSIKLALQLNKQKGTLVENGASSGMVVALEISSIVFILSIAGLFLPFPWLDLFRPIPLGLLLLMPGIILGRKISITMEQSGIDTAANAGKTANNIMWLGIGLGILITAYILFGFFIDSMGNEFPV